MKTTKKKTSKYWYGTNNASPKISITDFQFVFTGHGHYKVTYTSPVTGKQWSATVTYMPIIDATKNAEFGEAKIKDLKQLKEICKREGSSW